MHQCNGLCGLCCLLRPSVDPYRRQIPMVRAAVAYHLLYGM